MIGLGSALSNNTFQFLGVFVELAYLCQVRKFIQTPKSLCFQRPCRLFEILLCLFVGFADIDQSTQEIELLAEFVVEFYRGKGWETLAGEVGLAQVQMAFWEAYQGGWVVGAAVQGLFVEGQGLFIVRRTEFELSILEEFVNPEDIPKHSKH